jgi:hypothetical protein
MSLAETDAGMNVERIKRHGFAAPTCWAAACASVFERPTMRVSNVSRGSSGELPSLCFLKA